MEAGHVSSYFARRSGRKRVNFPKFWCVIHAASHLCLSMATGQGPGPDDPMFQQISRDAVGRLRRLEALSFDAGFDSEAHHEYLNHTLGVFGIIPPQRGRPRTVRNQGSRGGHFRNFLHHHWPRRLYGQRWQVETFYSMVKRLLDSFLRATSPFAQCREMWWKVLSLNIMIIANQ